MKKVLMSGNEAVARGAWEAGVKVAAAYPGTPSTEILEALSEYREVYSEWSTNEKVALEVAAGAAISGRRALFAAKQVGINVAADPLFTLSYTGVNAGLVIISADEPGVFSSQNEQDNRHYAAFAKIPMLEPSDSEEARRFVKLAFEISEKFDTPVLLRMTTRVCHTKTVVCLEERIEVPDRPYSKDIEKRVMIPSNAIKRHMDVEKRLERLTDFSNSTDINVMEIRDLEYGYITSGICYQYAREVLGEMSSLKLGMTYPLPMEKIHDFAKRVNHIYVIEENDPYLEREIRATGLEVDGKTKILQVGELSSGIIERRIKARNRQTRPSVAELPGRSPQFCPGCPHRGFFYLAAKHGFTVTGDIGCYGLGVTPPFEAIDTVLCMGASVTMAHGFDRAGYRDTKVIGVIGDSTFWHTGVNGIINSAYNNGKSTIVIMDNMTTAMTGHQVNPSSGRTLMGEPSFVPDWEKVLPALGVKSVRVVDAYDVDLIEKTLLEEVEKPVLSVIVVKRPCILQVKERAPVFHVDERKCRMCRQCLKMGCPALTIENGRISILAHFCRGCGTCRFSCKFDAIRRSGETE